jgi:hypothetical protein
MRSRSTGFDGRRSLELLYFAAAQQATGRPVSTGGPAPQMQRAGGLKGRAMPEQDGVIGVWRPASLDGRVFAATNAATSRALRWEPTCVGKARWVPRYQSRTESTPEMRLSRASSRTGP